MFKNMFKNLSNHIKKGVLNIFIAYQITTLERSFKYVYRPTQPKGFLKYV